MKIIKFGGKSLSNGKALENVITILKEKKQQKEALYVVLSARGSSTDLLNSLLKKAKKNEDYKADFEKFKQYQKQPLKIIDYSKEFKLLEDILQGVQLTRDYSAKTKDLVLAQGELLSVKMLATLLIHQSIKTKYIDSRVFIKTDSVFGAANVDYKLSKKETLKYFNGLDDDVIPIITGFIASNKQNETTTLGRNGSNYSASLLANFLDANSVISYTHINGIYSANPEIVENAQIIEQINYKEANELSLFGASILHTKTIEPLVEKKIPLHILNTFNSKNKGTIINDNSSKKGLKSITVKENIGIVNIAGKGLLGKIGIDARIFNVMSNNQINIEIISQGSSETGISFIVSIEDLELAKKSLLEEFQYELFAKDIHAIDVITDVAVITIVGQGIGDFSSSLKNINKNNIKVFLINSTIFGNNISLVIKKEDIKKAINIIHSQIIGITKTYNIAIFGKGAVGSTLINQIGLAKKNILKKKLVNLNIFAVVGSKEILLDRNGINKNWKKSLSEPTNITDNVLDVIEYANKNHLINLIAIDNTASEIFVDKYITLLKNGFDLISSNKIANTQPYNKYTKLKQSIKQYKKNYFYETNVGAGLPIIDTIRILHESGEKIVKIRGVFSGSLSYIFNEFSKSNKPFSYFLKKAIEKGYTEPNPSIDLSGIDVGRKLIILARELNLKNDLKDVLIENLIPNHIKFSSKQQFLNNQLDEHYQQIKSKTNQNEALRYVGELEVNLNTSYAKLSAKLEIVKTNTPLGNLKKTDALFEIYTKSYGENPMIISGAGAGSNVTARGVFGDLLKIIEKY